MAGRAVVSECGLLQGTLTADEVMISGKVEGDIIVKQKSLLGSTAQFTGNIETSRLVVEEGAMLNGKCQMGKPGEGLKGHVMQPKAQGSRELPAKSSQSAAA